MKLELPKRNPAFYCLDCEKYIGHRGFCSQKCHDKWYDDIVEWDEDGDEK